MKHFQSTGKINSPINFCQYFKEHLLYTAPTAGCLSLSVTVSINSTDVIFGVKNIVDPDSDNHKNMADVIALSTWADTFRKAYIKDGYDRVKVQIEGVHRNRVKFSVSSY